MEQQRARPWLAVMFAASSFAGVAYAQGPASGFVVSGAAADAILDSTTINLATAKAIGDACVRLAGEEGVGISVYVLDPDGNHVYIHRTDGQVWTNVATAEMKAITAQKLRGSSKALMNEAIRDQSVEWREIELGLFANSGGLPIIVDDQMIGAIGVGGSAPRLAEGWSDEICGYKGVTEVVGPQPPLLEDIPGGPRPATRLPSPRFAAAAAPESPLSEEFVVSGDAAKSLFDANHISANAARAVVAGCQQWVGAQGGSATVYVIDPAGLPVHMERMDGQVTHDITTARLKAETALKGRSPTSAREAAGHNNPGGFPRSVGLFGFYSVGGGVPIVVDGQLIGSVGVSGTEGKDEACAVAGLKAAFGDHATVPVYPNAG
jgi:glc operon protein GlcG